MEVWRVNGGTAGLSSAGGRGRFWGEERITQSDMTGDR